jgi:hypothetical protein
MNKRPSLAAHLLIDLALTAGIVTILLTLLGRIA